MLHNEFPFFDQLDRFCEQVALIEHDKRVSYAELLHDADAFSAPLGTQRLLVFLEARNTIEAVTAYIGCLRGGHVVYLFGEGDEARLQALADTYRPNLIIRHAETGRTIERLHEAPIALHPDLAVLLSTSGSTGSPKFVKLSRKNITSNALAIVEYLGLNHTERAITALRFNYSYGLSIIHSHLACGASVVLTDISVMTPDFWSLFSAQGATSFAGVPYTFEILQKTKEWAEIPGLRYVTQAGGRLAPEIVRHMGELGRQNNWRFFVMYGQTEAAPRMAYLPPEQTIDHPDCIGRAIPGGAFSIIDEEGAIVTGAETPGELVYAGPNIMMGYAENTADLSLDETPPCLKTGDIAVRTAEGLYRIVGRSSRFIKPFGVRVNLDELQVQIRQRAAGAVCTGSDAQLVVTIPEDTKADNPALIQWLAETYNLPAFMITVISVKAMPLLANGKIDYQTILRLAPLDEPAPQPALPVSGNGKWDSIQAIFTSFTGTRTVDKDSTFLTLAGDSLSYVVTSLAIEAYLGFLPADWETMSVSALEKLRGGSKETAAAERLHYLNASRVLLLLIGIPYHTIMLFIAPPGVGIAAPFRSLGATLMSSTFHSFRMSAFFFISGYFSMLLLRRAKASRWLRRQAIRLGVPALLGSIVLAPLEIASASISPEALGKTPLDHWITGMTTIGGQWLNHRWFLVTLLGLAIILALIVTLNRNGRFGKLPDRFFAICDQYTVAVWIIFLTGLIPAGMALSAIHHWVTARWSLATTIYDPFSIFYFAPAFFVGATMLLKPKWFERYLKPTPINIVTSLAFMTIFVATYNSGTLIGKIMEHACWIPSGMLGTQLLLMLMKHFAAHPHPLVTRLIDSSYVIYLWHMTFLLLFGGICLHLHLSLPVSFILTTVATFACSWAVYLIVARSKLLSLIFNGGPLRG